MKYAVKIIVGFRRDQEHSIPATEAHKAYYLFTHPNERGIFSNGLAIKGDQIQEIVPDYHGTMGWNPTHVIDNDDWTEMNRLGVSKKMNFIMSEAKEIGTRGVATELNTPLNQLLEGKTPETTKVHKGTQSMKDLRATRLSTPTPTL